MLSLFTLTLAYIAAVNAADVNFDCTPTGPIPEVSIDAHASRTKVLISSTPRLATTWHVCFTEFASCIIDIHSVLPCEPLRLCSNGIFSSIYNDFSDSYTKVNRLLTMHRRLSRVNVETRQDAAKTIVALRTHLQRTVPRVTNILL